MSRQPTHDTADGHAYLSLKALAQKEGRDSGDVMGLYALEGLLARLATSRHAGSFILKGGRRPTRDIDMLAADFAADRDRIAAMFAEVAAIDIGDGLAYEMSPRPPEPIREGGAGIRVALIASLFTARLAFHVDVNFGDQVWPGPAEIAVPGLLGGEVVMPGYPLHMVLAEKITAIMDKGASSTRWRDFADVSTLTRLHDVDGSVLVHAVAAVARQNDVELLMLAEELDGYAESRQSPWQAWRRRMHIENLVAGDFPSVVDEVIWFADPVIDGSAEGSLWSARRREWR